MSNLIHLLALETGLPEATIKRIAKAAPERYKTYFIKKKNGGYRKISQPAREVKSLQRALIKRVLSHLPIHEAATAYRTNRNIRDNALPHAAAGPILKMDFRDFFPSIKDSDWIQYCRDNSVFDNEEDTFISSRILFKREPRRYSLRLAIGAPSSPLLSNILMRDFDEIVSRSLQVDHVTYTRYADDMTFSAPRTGHLTVVRRIVTSALREVRYPRLHINEDKTVYATKKYHRQVTGLVISNDGKITVGRNRKRLIRSMVHRFLMGADNAPDAEVIAGQIAFIKSAEPEYFHSLTARYGSETIRKMLQKGVRPTSR